MAKLLLLLIALLTTQVWATPDAVVTSLDYANGIFTSVVKNQGDTAIPASTIIGVGYRVDGVSKTWGSVPGPLAAGASVTLGSNGGVYVIPVGTHVIMATVDDVNRFVESNEANNKLSKTIEGNPPPITKSGAAFPGAEGGGALSLGGRGGNVIEVTNLNDSGTGSLRACIVATGARICVFRVGGTLKLLSQLTVVNPYLTIAGQTAPGGGILLNGVNLPNANNMIRLATHDVILSYLRIRTGRGTATSLNSGTAISIEGGSHNDIIDHISASWTRDESIGLWGNANLIYNVTLAWVLSAEGLSPHSTGFLMGSDSSAVANQMTNIDIHHTITMNNSHRNPLVKIKSFRFVNNIVYNWNYYATMIGQGCNADLISNSYKWGPLSHSDPYEIEVYPTSGAKDQATGATSVYIVGNKGPRNANPDNNNWAMVGKVSGENGTPQGALSTTYKRNTALSPLMFPITVEPVARLETKLLPTVGASQRLSCEGGWIANRDSVDTRLISQYQTNTGIKTLVSNESQVGGFPVIADGTPCVDTDHDGMPDVWETAHQLNPNNATDRNTTASNGYRNLENYLAGF